MSLLTLDRPIGQKLAASRLIAVLVIDEIEQAVPTAQALLAGGIEIMELTLRTPVALEALRAIRAEVPEMTAGIGTILTTAQVDEVVAADAAFGVSPAVNRDLLAHARDAGLPFSPGIMTPTDIDQSVEAGCRVLKYFPAGSAGGLSHLKNIAAPYQHLGVTFIPLGGVNLSNLSEYLASPLITAVGGSWLAPRELIAARDWAQIEKNAREARARI